MYVFADKLNAVFFAVDLIVDKCELVLNIKVGGLDHPKGLKDPRPPQKKELLVQNTLGTQKYIRRIVQHAPMQPKS